MLRTQAFFCSRSLYNCLSVCTIKRLQIFKKVLLARHFISQQLKKKKSADVFQTFPSSKAQCSCSQHFRVQLKKDSSCLSESSQLSHWALRGEKIFSPPLHIPNINPICTKWNCEEQQCQTQALRAHESALQQSWDWFLNHAIDLPPPKLHHFCLPEFWKPKPSGFVFLAFLFFFLTRTCKDQ